jgi:hypothetical protein
MLYGDPMEQDLKALDGYVSQRDWPHVNYPTCGNGFLTPDVLDAVPSMASERAQTHESWEPDWISGTFHGLLRCAVPSCAETVSVVGNLKVGPTLAPDSSWDGADYDNMFQLRFALPALTILTPPAETPEEVKEAIKSASQMLWIDPSAAANRLRLAIEALLTNRGMPRFAVSNGTRSRLTTHARIVKFKKYEGEAGEALEAVKWIGNSGSHEDTLTVSDVLDGTEMLSYALRLIYDKSDKELQRRIRSVNKAKGVPKKRATARK